MDDSRTPPRRRSRAGQPATLGLAEATALGILLPGNTVRVACAGESSARPDRRFATFLDGRLEAVDLAAGTVLVSGTNLSSLARGEKVEFAYGVPGGLYHGMAQVARVDRAVLPPRVAISLAELRRVDERRAERVALPGVRATVWLAGRVCDVPVADLSPGGIGLHADLPDGSGVRVRLAVPGAGSFDLRGRITWSDAASGRAGVAFSGMDEDARGRLTFICLFHRALSNQRWAR